MFPDRADWRKNAMLLGGGIYKVKFQCKLDRCFFFMTTNLAREVSVQERDN